MNVSHGDLVELFTFFANMKGDIDIYKDSNTALEAQDRCIAMMSRDYMVSLVPNTFCPTYPKDIILLGNLGVDGEEPIKAGELRAHEQYSEKLKELMEASRHCRCRQRIPVPILVVRNKTIARSAGLSDALETVYETGSMKPLNDPVAFRKKMTDMDTKWLRTLLLSDICDLMTEVKSGFLGVTLVHSEKGIKEYYDEGFALSSLPYPGVQYYKNYVAASGTGNYPVPPWHKWKLEPRLGRPMRLPSPYRWQEYKQWTQLELTQNVVRYLFSVLREPKCSGLLVHCISGWDRTPHAISLLRILLWAEGESHQSLNVDQMLYLTVAYDWFLFGHQLAHRLKKAQEIMFYTFDVLGHLLSADFSLYLGDYLPPSSVRQAPQLRSANSPQNPALKEAHSPRSPSDTQNAASSSSASPAAASSSQDPSTPNSDANHDVLTSNTLTVPTTSAEPKKDENTTIAQPIASKPLAVPNTTNTGTVSPSPKKASPSIDELINQPVGGLDLQDRIAARKHRLFELRDRFFYFYKTCIYPTYHK